ncbi:MAG: hypothetical protein PHF74_05600 [Dehalococcoidales bacterium]|nr:hypothetical protein [Dehalococcoidales bacterium]
MKKIKWLMLTAVMLVFTAMQSFGADVGGPLTRFGFNVVDEFGVDIRSGIEVQIYTIDTTNAPTIYADAMGNSTTTATITDTSQGMFFYGTASLYDVCIYDTPTVTARITKENVGPTTGRIMFPRFGTYHATTFADDDITNVGDIALDSISPDATNISVTINSGLLGIGDGTYAPDNSAAMLFVEGPVEFDDYTRIDSDVDLNGAINVSGTATLSTVDINAGAIDGAAIGANSASTGAFSTLSATGVTSVTDTTEASAVGTASLKTAGGLGVAKKLYLGTELNMATGLTGTQSIVLRDSVADALSITRGSTDVIVIDSSSPAVTITPNTDVVGALTAGSVASDAEVSGTTITASTGFALGDGDYIGVTDNEVIKFNTAGTVKVEGADFYVGGTAADNITPDLVIVGDADSDGSATTSEALTIALTGNATPTSATWGFTSTQSAGYTFDKAVTFTGGIANAGTVTTADIDGGSIDGAVIGANSAAAGTFAAIKGTSISIGSSGAEVEITSTPATLNQVVNFPGMQATAAVDFNAVGTAEMVITIDGATYSETDVADAPNGYWTNGSSAADSATSLIAAINGDTREAVPMTAYADDSGDGVILIWDAVGAAGNVTVVSSDGSATTATAVGGENAGTKQVINVTRTITTNDLLAGVITIPMPFVPTGFNINAVNASGAPVYFTDTVTIAATPNRILITTDGGTNLANTNIVHLTVWQ